MKHLVLIDGHHLMYRAFYAIPSTMQTTQGEQTNAVYGVASMLLAILRIEEPDALLFCFDAGEETFRHKENATYKDGRAETPDEFYNQIPRIIEMIETFGIQHVSDPKFEADDFLGTYATVAAKEGWRVTIVTGDRDAFQLASPNIRVAIPHKGYQQTEYLGPKEVEAKFGVTPEQVASYKGLVGDSSDNLPGVHGIGPKTATLLLQQYGSLTGVYEHLADIKPTVRAKLDADREQAFFCEHMAQLVLDIPLPCALEAIRVQKMDIEPVMQFFHSVEFAALERRLLSLADTPYGKSHLLAPAKAQMAPTSKEAGERQLSLF